MLRTHRRVLRVRTLSTLGYHYKVVNSDRSRSAMVGGGVVPSKFSVIKILHKFRCRLTSRSSGQMLQELHRCQCTLPPLILNVRPTKEPL